MLLAQKDHFSNYAWTLSRLQAAFKRLTLLAPTLSKRLCFFIDGLDEYEGDHEEMSELFKNISSLPSSHIKICVSSRPWVVFDEAFGAFPRLRLQNLTRDDIKSYVNDKLEDHHRMRQLAQVEPKHAVELVEEIITKASGVFLWVTIVVKSLLSGLLNRDKIDDLRQRLQELPSELGSLYAHMLSLVEPFYREQSARAFQIYTYIAPKSEGTVNALEFQIAISATSQTMMDEPLLPMRKEEMSFRQEELDIYLKSRCAGLLEIHQQQYWHSREDNKNHEDENDNYSPLQARVAYLHRTAKDFFASKEARMFFSGAGHPLGNFSIQFSINKILTIIIKLKRSLLIEIIDKSPQLIPISDENIWYLTTSVMQDSRELEEAGNRDYIGFLDELCRAGFHLWKREIDDDHDRRYIWDPIYKEPWNKRSSFQRLFLGEAVTQKLCGYVEAKLKQDKSLISNPRQPSLLNFAFPSTVVNQPICPSIRIVELLLRLNADPNQLWHGNTPWQHALSFFHREFSSIHYVDLLPESCSIFAVMLRYGASIYTTCTHNHGLYHVKHLREPPHSVRAVIKDVF